MTREYSNNIISIYFIVQYHIFSEENYSVSGSQFLSNEPPFESFNQISCADECSVSSQCDSFAFNEANKSCVLGNWNATETSDAPVFITGVAIKIWGKGRL